MDPHDKEFETFLRQFRLRKPGPLHEKASSRRRPVVRFALAAAAVVLLGFLSVRMIRNHNSFRGPVATVAEAGSPSLYMVGEKIEAGIVIRSNSAKGLVLGLEDGSQVEMHTQSELKLEAAGDGVRVRLNAGSILVTAAKQGVGHLYVQTRDAMVSVVGTVFLVHAEQAGTRVAVVEGEVHVQQGAELRRLSAGEQVATNSSIALIPVAEEISWSRSAPEYFVLLPHSATEAAVAQTGRAPEVKEIGLLPPTATGPSTRVLPYKVEANYVRLTSDSIRTLITVEIMTRDLAFHAEGGGQVATAHITGVVYRSDNLRMPGSSFSQDITVPFTSENALKASLDRPNLYQATTYLAPGKYKLHLTVEDKNSQSIKTDDILLSPPRIPDQSLQASSMILAYSVTDMPPKSVGTEMFVLGDKKVKPNISGVFRQDEILNVWQEFYGLAADSTTHKPSASIELLISQNRQEIKKLVSSSSELAGPDLPMRFTNSVPLADIAPGQYEVQVKVTDNLAKQSLVTASRFSVVATSAPQRLPQLTSAPQAGNSTSVASGKVIVDKTCTQCHSADVARQLGKNGPQFSMLDVETLNNLKAERDQLLITLTSKADRVMAVQSQIDKLESKAADLRRVYEGNVSGHLAGFGVGASGADVRAMAEYLFEVSGKQTNSPPPVKPEDIRKDDSDVAGERILNTACTTCHDLGAIAGRTGDRKSWENIVNGMVGYGASVKDAEIPILVDYLFRHYGPPKEAPRPPAPNPPSDIPLQRQQGGAR